MKSFTTTRLIIKPLQGGSWVIQDRLDLSTLGALFIHKNWLNLMLKPKSRGLGVASEAAYALLRVLNMPVYKAKADNPAAKKFLSRLGFIDTGDEYELEVENLCFKPVYKQLNDQLGIDTTSLKTPRYQTSCQLVQSDEDCFQRQTRLYPHAETAWQKMKQQAKHDHVDLQLVSAFRSMHYQTNLIENKLNKNIPLSDILAVNTAPGHSEHHTGRAIDITTEHYKPLEQSFDQSDAFDWLINHAAEFGFTMSYPKNNKQGIIYEPWHWCFKH